MPRRKKTELNEDMLSRNDDGTVTVILKYPVTTKKSKITEVTVRRPKGRHLKVMDNTDGDVDGTLLLAAQLTDQRVKVIGDLDAYDLGQVNFVIEEMMSGNSPEPEGGGDEQ